MDGKWRGEKAEELSSQARSRVSIAFGVSAVSGSKDKIEYEILA